MVGRPDPPSPCSRRACHCRGRARGSTAPDGVHRSACGDRHRGGGRGRCGHRRTRRDRGRRLGGGRHPPRAPGERGCRLPPRPPRPAARGRGHWRGRLRLRAARRHLGEDRAAGRRGHRRRCRDRRQHLHRPGRAGRHGARGRREARQPRADRPQRACRRPQCLCRLRGRGGQRTHRTTLHRGRRRHHPGAPRAGGRRSHHGRHGDHALHPQAGAVQRRVSLPWEKNAATLRQLHALRDRLRALENKT